MKKQTKKTISVFLAVLMLLGCWVFVAPQKAGAVKPGTEYSIVLEGNLHASSKSDGGSNFFPTFTVDRSLNGGTGTKTIKADPLDTLPKEGADTPFSFTIESPGFPTSILWKATLNKQALTNGDEYIRVTISNFSINGVDLKGDLSATTFDWNPDTTLFANGSSVKSTTTTISSTHRPKATSAECVAEPTDLQLPVRNDGSFVSTTFRTAVSDQYGVVIGNTGSNSYANPSLACRIRTISTNGTVSYSTDSSTNYITASVTGTKSDGDIITLKATNAAKFVDLNSDEKELVERVTYSFNGGTVTCDVPFRIINPKYTVQFFDPDNIDDVLDPDSYEDSYGFRFELPTGKRPGYDLLGMYYKKDSSNNYISCGGKNYDLTRPTNPASLSGFGTALTPDSSTLTPGRTVIGSDIGAKYYAGWWAQNVTATFVDNAGNKIATITGKYDKKLGDVSGNNFNKAALLSQAGYISAPNEEGEYKNMRAVDFRVDTSNEFIDSYTQQEGYRGNYGQSVDGATLVGDTVFRAIYKPEQSAYSVTFLKMDGSTHSQKTDYAFNDTVQIPAALGELTEDNRYTYEFIGWAEQRYNNADRRDTYYVTDLGSTAVPLVYDLRSETPAAPTVTRDLTLVAVYERTFKDYAVDYHITVDGGEAQVVTDPMVYHFNDRINPPAEVRKDYVSQGHIYHLEGWYTDSACTAANRVVFDGTVLMNDVNGRTFYAKYTMGEATLNQIRFLLENENGADTLLAEGEIEYSTTNETDVADLRDEAIEKLTDLRKYNYNTADERYTFDGWTPELDLHPTKPVDYYVKYDVKPLITVSLNTQDLAGNFKELWYYIGVPGEHLNLSALGNQLERITRPARANDAYGTDYQFIGWGPEEGFLQGENEELTADIADYVIGEEDVSLFAKYSCTPKEYTVTFRSENTQDAVDFIPPQTGLHYGDEVTIPEVPEEYKTKETDDTYHYVYKGWNLDPSHVCIGDANYYLVYRRMYNYYTVQWMQIDEKNSTEGNPAYKVYKTEKYIYNEILRTPFDPPANPAPVDTGMEWVLSYWTYASGEQNGQQFHSGDRLVRAAMDEGVVQLYPSYEQAPQTYTVRLFSGKTAPGYPFGEIIGIWKYPYNTSYLDISAATTYTPPANSDGHYVFNAWRRIGGDQSFPLDTENGRLTENLDLVASYTLTAHNWDPEITVEPTFAETGLFINVCSVCGYRSGEQVIPVLQDTTAPTGRIYVQNHSWTGQAAFNVSAPVPAGFDNMIVVNTIDTADNEADTAANGIYNETGKGSGVKNVQLYLGKKTNNIAMDFNNVTTWHDGYVYRKGTQGNLALTLQNLIDTEEFGTFENGDKVILVAKITDGAEAGEDYVPQVTYLNTEILLLDDTAPTVVVTSSDNQNNAISHCEDVTLICNDTDLASATLNGSSTLSFDGTDVPVLDLFATGEEGGDGTITPEGGRTITQPGQYQLVVTDLAGNQTSLNFEIVGSHAPKQYRVEPSCTEDGYIATRCTRCGTLIGEMETLEATGHTKSATTRRIDPTCEKDGEEYYYCIICGEKMDVTVLPKFPDHDWQTLSEGYIVKEATCVAQGTVLLRCKNCGEEKTEAYGPLDPESTDPENGGHRFYGIDTVEASCTEPGKQTKECMYCHQVFDVATLPALGHQAGSVYERVIRPDCENPGLEAPLCKRCNLCLWVAEDAADRAEFEELYSETWREVDALGHDWDDGVVTPPTTEEGGYTTYTCRRDPSHTYIGDEVPKLENCTLTAYDDDGTTVLGTVTKQKGAYVTTDEIGGEPTKAADETYTYKFADWTTVNPDAEEPADPEEPGTPEEPETPDEPETPEDPIVKMPVQLNGDMVIYATYKKTKINYTINFFQEDGETKITSRIAGYGDELTVTAEKAETATHSFTFLGWIPLDAGEGTDPIETITVEGNTGYKAVFEAVQKRYHVVWGYNADEPLASAWVNAGESVSYPGPTPVKWSPDAETHAVFSGWDQNTTDVTSDMLLTAQFTTRINHSFTEEYTQATCTQAAGVKRTCTVCGHVIVLNATQPALGHLKEEYERVNPVINPDDTVTPGYVKYRCSRCGEELPDEYLTLTESSLITLKITVKDKKGNPIEGAKVSVLDGSVLIDSKYTNAEGLAVLRVPQAKAYTIVIEYGGKTVSSDIEVSKTGKITGTIPTVDSNTASTGCSRHCTCHKSGLWATIFRFMHKIIYAFTRTKCCPDATYL